MYIHTFNVYNVKYIHTLYVFHHLWSNVRYDQRTMVHVTIGPV